MRLNFSIMAYVIALDLEGTLLSNSMSQIPRPGLFEFLEGCKAITDRVVMYTTVKEERFRNIADLLVADGFAPEWFKNIEFVPWQGKTKDLTLIPNIDISNAVLVDDYSFYVHKGQEDQWVEIAQFGYPYPEDDKELSATLSKLKQRL
ncbi:MAG: hypothetical protein GY829_06665, partial [Gammaproteobacteria bacterium]|nr:hypothetical protein [Gammaproteobacteria bacterium]